jgi:parallel beta-helix repeat protein
MPTAPRCRLAAAAILATALATALAAHAADQPILGTRLAVSGSPVPTKRGITLRAKELASPDTLVGDPTMTGAMLTVSVDGTSPTSDTYALPPGASSKTGRPFWSGDLTRGFRYRDNDGENGPVRSLRIRKTTRGTFEIRARVDGRLGPITVAPPNTGTGGCALLEITDGDSYSVAFADGTLRNDGADQFKATGPVTQGSCTKPPGPSPTPIGTVDPASTLVGCDQADARITVTSSIHLDPACIYTRGFEIVASDVTLDCRGASIVKDLAFNTKHGILIEAPTSVPLHDVTVRNCTVSSFDNNLRITREGFKDLPVGSEYEHAFSNILIENDTFLDSENSGVFVNAFVTGVRFSRNAVTGAGSVGIYLEAGSKDNVVEQSVVADNGWKDVIPGPASIVIGGTTIYYVSTGREGIAVDGSRNNVIRDNLVTDNAAGGVFVYKNCGEDASRPGHWVRNYGASGNVIRHNVVGDGPNGIWVGSRSAENQVFMDCSDTPIVDESGLRVYLDPAPDTTIEYNRIDGMTNAIRVEADGTIVRGNVMRNAERGVLAGSKYRTTVLAMPIANTTITANTTIGTTTPYSWVWGTGATTFTANAADGSPGVLVPGTQPTINPFLGVIEILGP